ncbi:putative 2-hydroxyacid dehydrogenase [Colletotrichum caudatum]|nr:putative 2-hydroxyacid dehydrogenase [Colletotrichum caudatum]
MAFPQYDDLGSRKPRVVALGTAKKLQFDYSVLEVTNREETIAMLPEDIKKNGSIDAFVIRMGTPPYEPFDQGLLGALVPSCKIITSASAGFNQFDFECMTSETIWFCNTVDATGTWRAAPGLVPGKDLSGLTLGIVGMGAIRKYLAKKAAMFNLKITYHNRQQLPAGEEAKYNAVYCPALYHLLGKSDIVSLNCLLNEETTGLIRPAEFAAMEDGTFLINTACGPVINEAALKEALESGKVARAGLDVFCDEPKPDLSLLQDENVIAQPHLGGLTDMAFQKAERKCFENIKSLSKTGKPNPPINDICTSKEELSGN